jgi:hypothetical protein
MKILEKISAAFTSPWETPEARTRALKRLGPPRRPTLQRA